MRFPKLIVLTLALMVSQVYAQRITAFRADVDLRKDGSAAVTEEVTVQGSPFLQRNLRLWTEDATNRWDVDIKLLSVRDSSGTPLRYEAATRESYLQVRVPLSPPFDQPQTVLLTYEVRHAIVVYWEAHSASLTLTFADDHGGPVPVDNVLVTATVPDDPRGGLSAGLTGPERKPQVTISGRTARLSGQNVPAGYWLTMSISFPIGMVSLPARDWLHQETVRLGFACLLGLAFVGVMLWYRRSIGAKGELRPADIPLLIPPPPAQEPEAAPAAGLRRCRICGATPVAASEELCPTCIADRELLSREIQQK